MSKRAKRLRRRIREGDPGVKNLFDIRISTAPMLSDEELAAMNDKFPGGEFDWARWSAKSVSGATVGQVRRPRRRHPDRTVMTVVETACAR